MFFTSKSLLQNMMRGWGAPLPAPQWLRPCTSVYWIIFYSWFTWFTNNSKPEWLKPLSLFQTLLDCCQISFFWFFAIIFSAQYLSQMDFKFRFRFFMFSADAILKVVQNQKPSFFIDENTHSIIEISLSIYKLSLCNITSVIQRKTFRG